MKRTAFRVASLVEPPRADGHDLARLAGAAEALEVRADRVGDLDPDWLRGFFPGPILYTLRSRAEGGAFSAARERRTRRLIEAAKRYDWVDLESDRDLAPELLAELPPERRVLSWHGPATDLPGLAARFAHLAKTPARIYKLVPAATHSGEELVPLRLLAAAGRDDLVAFAGGEVGFWTRLVAPRLGAPWIFAAAGETPAAPGQLPLARLNADYGLPELPPARLLAGVVGAPALGSLSPRLHNAAYRALDLPLLYVPFEAPHFGDFWLELVETESLAEIGLRLAGFSVTTPHKEVALAVSGAASPLAQAIGAANTLVPNRGVWEAESTDAEGVVEALAARRVRIAGRAAAVLGGGGAGRAAALGLARAGARVAIVQRDPARGRATAARLGLPFVPRAELDPRRFDLLVNATPLGRGAADELPAPVAELERHAVIVDLVYGGEPTRWVADARRRGLVAIDGREVLIFQARPQFRAMTGHDLPLALAWKLAGLAEETV